MDGIAGEVRLKSLSILKLGPVPPGEMFLPKETAHRGDGNDGEQDVNRGSDRGRRLVQVLYHPGGVDSGALRGIVCCKFPPPIGPKCRRTAYRVAK